MVESDMPEPMLQDGQGDPDVAWATQASPKITGLVQPPTPFQVEVEDVKSDVAEHDSATKTHEITEPAKKSRRKNGGERTDLIANPPKLPPHVQDLAEKQSERAAGDLEAQQQLRKELDEKQKAEALKKKTDAEDKQKRAVEQAVAKAEQKLAKAKAKAAALQNKLDGKQKVRRNLAGEFAAVKEDKASPKPSPKKPAQAKQKAKPRNPNVKLSPKAKKFARKAVTPKAATPEPSNKSNKAMEKALAALETLRDLKLDDLPLPDPATLTKKSLACILVGKLYHVVCMFPAAQNAQI